MHPLQGAECWCALFAERRTDIFGVDAAGAEQTVIGRKLGEEAPQPAKINKSTKFIVNTAPYPMRRKNASGHDKTDELEPEAEWLKKVNGAIDLRIQLPVSAEFNMDGSIIGLQINVSSQHANKIAEAYFDGFFLKDNFSLAFYNMKKQSFVILQIKERGGKNK
ncbi:unnamed protein product [Cylicocyclus nassatus]|uniref:Ubiquitin-like domain-containing protein n=1 Tax=Cylicocyclus nassatus TaxID=53992 RepID=A0AA36H5X7_CYLNA|nr:unnamed protein product [Cylicocyclus nassatus]